MHLLCLRRHSVQTTVGAAGAAIGAVVAAAAEEAVEGPAVVDEEAGVKMGVAADDAAGVVVVEGGAGRM